MKVTFFDRQNKKNIGKVKSKTSRLIKSKKISRRRKRQNNKIQKVLKQSGSGPDLLRAASGDYGFVLEELKREIREELEIRASSFKTKPHFFPCACA